MSTAQEVLDAIDLALDDPSVSADAMRWTPDREAARRRIVAREQARRMQGIRVPPLVDPERAAEAMRQVGERWVALVEALRPAFVAFGEAVQLYGTAIEAALRATVEAREEQRRRDAGLPTSIPLPPRDSLRDTDPRSYALEARRTRGTGPDRQVQHGKRPRRI